MGDLLHRRGDKRRQALPLRLPEDAQTAACRERGAAERIGRKSRVYGFQRVIEREIFSSKIFMIGRARAA